MVGKTFGKRYTVMERIGKGGMADVYKAEDSVLGRTLAIKVLHPQFAQETNFVARFKTEAQAAAGLNHPNIVSIYDWGHEDDTYFIAMEYLEGWNLKQLIEAQAPLPVDEALDLAVQVCSALDFAHQRGVVHRDIKSQNIIIAPHGQVKVADFGIARAGGASMTQTGSVMGTAEYISPEQAQGIQVGRTTDIYSLGIVLYEALTGQLPFSGENSLSVAMKQVKEKPLSPSLLNSEISQPLEQVILRALEKNPADRYGSAEEMKQDLLSVSKGLPIKPAPALKETDQGQTRIMPVTNAAPSRRRPAAKKWVGLAPLLRMGALGLGVLLGAYLIFALFIGVKVVVPDVKGKSLKAAAADLKEVGLKIKDEDKFELEDQENKVIEQDPEAGVKVRKGSPIRLVLEGAVTVPDLVGKTSLQAAQEIGRLGLKLGLTEEIEDTEAEAGTVIDQLPLAGEKVAPGTSISLTLSAGGPKIMPNLIGQTKDEALNLLEQLGIAKERIETKSVAASAEPGTVTGQNPEPNEEIPTDKKIVLEISSGSDLVTMPMVKGMTEEAAKNKLKTLGFSPDDVNVDPTDTYIEGGVNYVLDQDPPPFQKVRIGAPIILTVGQEA